MFTLSLHQFENLDKSSKTTEVLENGILIADRFYNDYKILLYQLHSFYVEIQCHAENNVIDMITSFTNTERLQPYLEIYE